MRYWAYYLNGAIVLSMGLVDCAFNPGNDMRNKNLLGNRRYNEIAFPASHNAQSYKDCVASNQDMPIAQQLQAGIRAMKVPVWWDMDKNKIQKPYACHGITKEFLEKPYLELIIGKLPSICQSLARRLLKDLEPINSLVRNALKAAYGNDGEQGPIPFAHCVFDPSRQPLEQVLKDIKQFLHANRDEVVTLILEDHTHNLDAIARSFHTLGLDRYAHVQDITKPWPTLKQMISKRKQLVVLLHGASDLPYTKYPWMHYIWDYAWDTEWDFVRACDMNNTEKDSVPKRGTVAYEQRHNEPNNKIFIVHHFITTRSCGSKACAKQVNRKSFLLNRLNRLQTQTGHIPNIVQVDFFQYPHQDLFAAINELNSTAY